MSELPTAILPNIFRPVQMDLVRLGSEFDGGYVLAEDAIRASRHLLSFGLCTDWQFEVDFLDYRGPGNLTGVDAYDPTLQRWLLFKRTARYFVRSLLGRRVSRMGTLSAYRDFFQQSNVTHYQEWIGRHKRKHTVDFNQCMKRIPPESPVYLKMDIEGSEYEIMDQITDNARRLTGISLEFHSLDQALVDFATAFEYLHERFHVVHVHVNNYGPLNERKLPTVLEVSYINKSLADQPDFASSPLPLNSLDMPNKRTKPDYQIQFSRHAA